METRKCDHEKMFKCAKRAMYSVLTLLAAARDLPQDVIPATKTRSGGPPKTIKLTDHVWRQKLLVGRNHHLSASELKEMHQDRLGNVSIRCIEHMQIIMTPRMRKKRFQFALRYLHGSVDDKKRVMWSDESTTQCIFSIKYRTFWCNN